jgi:hypothetical protein
VYRYESALKKEAIAGDVARARPSLAAIPSWPSWKRTVAIVASLAVLAGIGIWFLFRQEPLPAEGPAPRTAQAPLVSPPLDASATLADARPSVVTAMPPRADRGVPRPVVSPTTKRTRESQMPSRQDADELLASATDEFDSSELGKALTLAKLAAERGAGAPAYVLIGRILAIKRDAAGAQQAFEQALRLSPGNTEAARRLERLRRKVPDDSL